ncbi:MAG: TetR/AcrR family transcriptional regulator [Pseudomonadota bacterium]
MPSSAVASLEDGSRAPTQEGRGGRILEAAGRLFAERSFEGTSTADIATAANVAEGTIYRYFSNKRALLDAVVEQLIGRAYESAKDLLSHLTCPKERLRVFIKSQLRTIDENRDAAKLFIREVQGSEGYGTSYLRELNKGYAKLLVDTIQDGQARGDFDKSIDPYIFRDMIFGSLQHCAINFIVDFKRYDRDTLADTLSSNFLASLAPRVPPTAERLDAALERLENAIPQIERLSAKQTAKK